MRCIRLALLAVAILGCGDSPSGPEEALVDTWRSTFTRINEQGMDITVSSVTFRPDGTYLQDNNAIGTYLISGNLITVTITEGPYRGEFIAVTFEFSEGDKIVSFSPNPDIGVGPAGIYERA